MTQSVEPWLRGPVDGVPATLQPVAHALLMAREDVLAATSDLTRDEWAAYLGELGPYRSTCGFGED